MGGRRTQLQEDVHYRVLRLLEDNPEISQRALAEAVGISVGGAHYVLAALVERGMLKFANFRSSPDKRRYAYVLTPSGLAEKAAIARRFLARKHAEYEALKSEIEALQREVDLGADMAPRPDAMRPIQMATGQG